MSGMVGFTGPPDRGLLDRMLSSLRHRGELVGQPIETAHGSVAVCEWSSRDSIGQLQTGCYRSNGLEWAFSGFAFDTLPTRPNVEGFRNFRGSFAVACLGERQLVVARDAMGCQSLYYALVAGRWLIASEPKAITSEPTFLRQIRPAAIAQYLSFSFVPGQGTMLEGLFKAEAGHLVAFGSSDAPSIERFFDFETHEYANEHSTGQRPTRKQTQTPADRKIDESYWIQRTRKAIEEAVAERLPRGPVGVFLSGGLDSSIVAAEAARQSSQRIRTFALHFGKNYPNELDYARAVAKRIGSDHEEVLIQPQKFLPRMRQMIWHLDEPIGDPITQPNFELAAHVSKEFSYILNGEGGDPLFGGPKNLTMMLAHWYGGIERPPKFREQAYLASYRRAYEEWSRLLSPGMRDKIDPTRDLESVLTPFFTSQRPQAFLNKLMAINIRLKGANLILPKVDRMLAAHHLTPLSPLFDDRLTQLSFEMPPQMKLRHGHEKYVLKRAYESDLPAEVIHRPKSGMRVPVHYWFQSQLRRYAAKNLRRSQIANSGIFDPGRIQQILRYECDEGKGRFGIRIWMVLTFEIWRRIVVDREAL